MTSEVGLMKNLKKLMVLCLGTCLTVATLTGCEFSFDKQWVWDSDSEKFEEVNYEDYGYDSSESVVKDFWKAFAKCDEDKLKDGLYCGDIAYAEYHKDVDDSRDDFLDDIMEFVESAEDKGITINYKDVEITDTDDYDLDSDKIEEFAEVCDIKDAEMCTVIVPETQEVDGSVYEIEETYEMITICVHDRWFLLKFDCTDAQIVEEH